MIIIDPDLIASFLAPAASLNRPLLGWRNVVTAGNVTATSALAAYPASNLGNPSTASDMEWRASPLASPPADIYLTVALGTPTSLDYIGLARHNLGSSGALVSVEHLDGTWQELIGPTGLSDDKAAMFQWAPGSYSSIRLRIQPGSAAPRIAVMYCGLLTKLPRNIYVGHTPVLFGRRTNVYTGRSEHGDYLGRVVLNRTLETDVSMSNCPPEYFRSDIHPFFVAAEEIPFFFAWRPYAFPQEIGYCWLTGDGNMSNQLPNGFVQFAFKLGAIAE